MLPTVKLNNDVTMPHLGLGVFQSPPEQTVSAVEHALTSGYRLIDTAAAYMNERQVGEGLRRSGVPRSDVFITTKLWVSDYGYDQALHAFDSSLGRLGLDYLDLYLLHWPVPASFDLTIAAWKAIERRYREGRVRAIGVSNFNPDHLDQLIERSDVIPAVNQVELHPFFTQLAVRDANKRHNVRTESWSPIGGVVRRNASIRGTSGSPLDHPVVVRIAQEHGKTAAQVLLRWQMEHGFIAIPKSVHPERITENADIFGFSLSAEEVSAIDDLDKGVRMGSDPILFTAQSYKVDINAQ
jgi:diketogulonate reductase-like aldo/keto reductase